MLSSSEPLEAVILKNAGTFFLFKIFFFSDGWDVKGFGSKEKGISAFFKVKYSSGLILLCSFYYKDCF